MDRTEAAIMAALRRAFPYMDEMLSKCQRGAWPLRFRARADELGAWASYDPTRPPDNRHPDADFVDQVKAALYRLFPWLANNTGTDEQLARLEQVLRELLGGVEKTQMA